MTISNETNLEFEKHSKWTMFSFGFGDLISEYSVTIFGMYVFFFYETELGLPSWVAATGYIIFAIWNGINDPIIGYLVDRPFKFTRKWGKRFPWIIGAIIPWVFSFVLIFAVPKFPTSSAIWLYFMWLVLFTCLYDTFGSIYGVNRQALFPEKFRDPFERRTASTIVVFISFFGTIAGALITPYLITYGEPKSYIPGALIFAGMGVICMLIMIPGHRESPAMIERAFNHPPPENFGKTLVFALKQKNFLGYVILYVAYILLSQSVSGSFSYATRFILKVDPSYVSTIGGAGIVTTLISFPIWNIIHQKVDDNRKMIAVPAICLGLAVLIFFFANSVTGFIIGGAFYGIFLAGIWILFRPIMGDVIDDVVVKYNKRIDGTIMGIFTFFSRMALVLQSVIFATVHTLTGFQEGADSQLPLAQMGIRLHMSVIPCILLILSTLIFLKIYKLTPEKNKSNREAIKNINI